MQSFKNLFTAALGVGALAVAISIPSLSAPTTANAQVINPPTAAPVWHRGEKHSAQNLVSVRRRLERLIDQMQHDAHDYGGNRVKAIADLQTARADIQAAISYDATHGH